MSLQVGDDAHKSRVHVKVENGTVMEADNVQGVMKVKNVMGVMEAENAKKVKVEKVKAENVKDEEVENKPGSPNSIISMSLSAKPPVAERFAAGRVLDTAFLQKGPEWKLWHSLMGCRIPLKLQTLCWTRWRRRMASLPKGNLLFGRRAIRSRRARRAIRSRRSRSP